MTIEEKINKYLNEGKTNIGDWVKQEQSDLTTYGQIVEKLKNGSDKAVVFKSYSGAFTGKAIITTTKGWYPSPVKIKESDIPDKILKKIVDKKKQMNITV